MKIRRPRVVRVVGNVSIALRLLLYRHRATPFRLTDVAKSGPFPLRRTHDILFRRTTVTRTLGLVHDGEISKVSISDGVWLSDRQNETSRLLDNVSGNETNTIGTTLRFDGNDDAWCTRSFIVTIYSNCTENTYVTGGKRASPHTRYNDFIDSDEADNESKHAEIAYGGFASQLFE